MGIDGSSITPMVLPPQRSAARRAGMTLVELMVVVVILVVGLGEIARSLLTVSRLEPSNRETALALDAATGTIEELGAMPFEEVVARYDANPADDPDGAGTGQGTSFAVAGLDVRADDPDGVVGRVELPLIGDELREDFVDIDLGMPRDLDGDGVIDAADHSIGYDVLPVRVVVEWRGPEGDRSLSLTTTLSAQ